MGTARMKWDKDIEKVSRQEQNWKETDKLHEKMKSRSPNYIIIIIIIKKRLAMQGREREIDTLSVRRPQPHTTNL